MMKLFKIFCLGLFVMCFSGCLLANRSVVHFEHQNATTGATVSDNGKRGAASVAAEKTTEATTAVNTASGQSEAQNNGSDTKQ